MASIKSSLFLVISFFVISSATATSFLNSIYENSFIGEKGTMFLVGNDSNNNVLLSDILAHSLRIRQIDELKKGIDTVDILRYPVRAFIAKPSSNCSSGVEKYNVEVIACKLNDTLILRQIYVYEMYSYRFVKYIELNKKIIFVDVEGGSGDFIYFDRYYCNDDQLIIGNSHDEGQEGREPGDSEEYGHPTIRRNNDKIGIVITQEIKCDLELIK